MALLCADLGFWDNACNNLPAAWGFVDPEKTIPVDFSLAGIKMAGIKTLLEYAFQDTFWQPTR